MNVDIVAWLREQAEVVHSLEDKNYPYAIGDGEATRMLEAADEIERLRRELEIAWSTRVCPIVNDTA